MHYEGYVADEPDREEFVADFSPCTDDWQFTSVEFAKTQYRAVESIEVRCEYNYNVGVVNFDDIQLVRTNIETGLTAADFAVEPEDDGSEEETTETTTETTPEFTEAVDIFGNTITETTFEDGEFGTIYRAFTYSKDGNDLVSEKDARGNVTSYEVDDETSRNKEVTDRCGNKTAYEYDTAGRTTKVTSKNSDGTELANVHYEYDVFNNLTEITRGDGMKYALAYNAFHNLESIGVDGMADPLVQYTYKNGNGRLKAVTYANGDTMKVTYNSAGQMTSEKWYNSAEELIAHYKYVYDGQGNIVRSIDFVANKEYTYTYEAGRLIRSAECDIVVNGEMVVGKTVVASIMYIYDSEGQLTKKRIIPVGGEEQVIFYENSDDKNIVVKFKVGDRTVTSHSKSDNFGRKVFDELQLETGFVSRQFSYYQGEKTEEHTVNGKLKSSPTTQLVKEIILSDGRTLAYEYDAEERITKVTDTIVGDDEPVVTVTQYTYDALGQLLCETVNGVVVTEMTYDNYGNILTKNGKVYTYGDSVWKDRLTAFDGNAITYDAQGNPTTYLGHTLTWEKGRQLKSFDNNTYTYNANGIRTSKTVDGVKHTYTLDGTKILRETWGDNTLVPVYDNEDSVCGIIYNDTPYYFQKNLQGDIIAITDENGDVAARYSYDAWGVCTVEESNCEIGEVNPFRYRGYYYDQEIGLYYLQSRYYDAEFGRFIKSDIPEMMLLQVEKATGTNLFAYCNNNSIDGNDPMGILDAAGVASWLSASSVFAMFAESLYTAFTATMTKIGLYITGILTPKAAAAFWWQPWVVVGIVVAAVAIVLAAVSVARSQAISKADAKVRSKVKRNSVTQYWSANFKYGYIDIGRALTYTQAVREVAAGRNVFTVTKVQARAVALAAGGNATPLFHTKHKKQTGYYDHYHLNGHTNDAHVWYLF